MRNVGCRVVRIFFLSWALKLFSGGSRNSLYTTDGQFQRKRKNSKYLIQTPELKKNLNISDYLSTKTPDRKMNPGTEKH